MNHGADFAETLVRVKAERKSFQPSDYFRPDFIDEIEPGEMLLPIGEHVRAPFKEQAATKQPGISARNDALDENRHQPVQHEQYHRRPEQRVKYEAGNAAKKRTLSFFCKRIPDFPDHAAPS